MGNASSLALARKEDHLTNISKDTWQIARSVAKGNIMSRIALTIIVHASNLNR